MTVNDLVERLNSLQGNITVGQLNEIIQDFDEQEPMRDATTEERESVRDYINSISKDTSVNFYGEKQSCEDAVSREAVFDVLNCGQDLPDRLFDMVEALPSIYPKELIRLKNSIIPLYRDGEVDEYNRGYNDCWEQVLEKIAWFQNGDVNNMVGHWEWYEDWVPSTTDHPAECQDCGWVCSECQEHPTDDLWDDADEKPSMKYCPNCGAKMEDINE